MDIDSWEILELSKPAMLREYPIARTDTTYRNRQRKVMKMSERIHLHQ